MTKFKVGDKVRIINENGIIPNAYRFKNGEVVKVTVVAPSGIVLERKSDGNSIGVLATEFGAIELVSDKPTKNQRITTLEQNVVSLESEVAELKAKVEALEKAQKPTYEIGVDFARTDADISKVASQLAESLRKATKGFVGKPNTNEQRKAIIAEAKAFIEDVTKRMASSDRNDEGNATFRYYTTKPEFHVNSKKRTVVALVKGLNGGSREVFEKAIAKCAPDDVFNADIGKAIALGRALGLDVSRFEQAVKPTEVVVGHVVNISNSIGSKDGAKVYEFANGAAGSPGILVTQFYGNRSDGFTWVRTTDAKQITDDTEAQY